jgi:hypothetical protein
MKQLMHNYIVTTLSYNSAYQYFAYSTINLNSSSHFCFVKLLLFLLYINDLPKATAGKATSVLFADDTSILITSPNISQFQNDSKIGFDQINRWFNLLKPSGSFTYDQV